VAVNLDDGGIYHGVFAVGIGIEGLKDLGENPAFNPTAVTLEHAVPVAKFGRQIAPWAAGTDNPQDGFDKETVETINRAYKFLFNQGGGLKEQAQILLNETSDQNVRKMCEFIINTKRGIPLDKGKI